MMSNDKKEKNIWNRKMCYVNISETKKKDVLRNNVIDIDNTHKFQASRITAL